MTTKGTIMAAAVAGLFLATPMVAQASGHAAKVKCEGINSCKGQSSCKSAHNSCKGKNGCAGKGWTMASKKECKAKGGKILASKMKM